MEFLPSQACLNILGLAWSSFHKVLYRMWEGRGKENPQDHLTQQLALLHTEEQCQLIHKLLICFLFKSPSRTVSEHISLHTNLSVPCLAITYPSSSSIQHLTPVCKEYEKKKPKKANQILKMTVFGVTFIFFLGLKFHP